jgi:hypothetical protein
MTVRKSILKQGRARLGREMITDDDHECDKDGDFCKAERSCILFCLFRDPLALGGLVFSLAFRSMTLCVFCYCSMPVFLLCKLPSD